MTTDTISRRTVNELIAILLRDHPRKTKDQLTELFTSKMLDDPDYKDYTRFVLRNYFGMNLPAIVRARHPASREELAARHEARQQQEQDELARIKNVILNNLLESDTIIGKKLKYCTGADCAKLGGFYSKIATEIAANDVVGDNFSNEELRALYANYRSSNGRRRSDRPGSRPS
jgi:hypothetical protein